MEENQNQEQHTSQLPEEQLEPKKEGVQKYIIGIIVIVVIIVVGFFTLKTLGIIGNNHPLTEKETELYIANSNEYRDCLQLSINEHLSSIKKECLEFSGREQCGLPPELLSELEAVKMQNDENCKSSREKKLNELIPSEKIQEINEMIESGLSKGACRTEATERYMNSREEYCVSELKKNSVNYEGCLTFSGWYEMDIIADRELTCMIVWKPEEVRPDNFFRLSGCEIPTGIQSELIDVWEQEKEDCG